MHRTALENAERFFQTYVIDGATVIDIGAQNVNGSLRDVCPHTYVGVDFVAGPGVDVVLTDPYKLPMADESADIVVSSSCFEHSEFFWVLFLEILRVLKPHGLLYLNAPSNGDFHRWPVDCWRFYPDAAGALAKWGQRNGINCVVLESYTANRRDSGFNDFVAVFVKDQAFAARYPARITDAFDGYRNGSNGKNASVVTQDQSSFVWNLRRINTLLRTPGARFEPVRVAREILTGRRKGIFPDKHNDPN